MRRHIRYQQALLVDRALADQALTRFERLSVTDLGVVRIRRLEVTSRKQLLTRHPDAQAALPERTSGLECVVLVDGQYAATLQFRDEPRRDGALFIHHLRPKHRFDRIMIVSGDRESEVRYLAEQVGISEVRFSQSPEQKVTLVREETRLAPTLFLGDGINDAPALAAATVGVAFGQNSDITAAAAGAVIMDSSLLKVDEFFHISRRMLRNSPRLGMGPSGR